MKNFKNAFTLIELLIVIAILGILAAGLIAALDPIDQIRRAQDTTLRQNAIEVRRAIDRYFVSQGQMPWCLGGSAGVTCAGNPSAIQYSTMTVNTAAGYYNMKGQLEQGEIKVINAVDAAKLYITGNAANTTAYVCFDPASKAMNMDANTKYTNVGVVQAAGTCVSQGGALTTCYYCVLQ